MPPFNFSWAPLVEVLTDVKNAIIDQTKTFLGMSDTPGDFTDQQGKVLQVNSAGDALEFGNFEISLASGYAFKYIGYNTGLYFNLSSERFEFHRDGNIVATIKAVTNQGDISANRDLLAGRNCGIVASGAYYVGASPGVSGSFTTVDGKTVTVTKGIITNIV